MNQLKKEIIIYFISISVGLFLITYLLEIPHRVTGNREIVNKYYLENFTNNVPLDFFFIIVYFIIGNYIIDILALIAWGILAGSLIRYKIKRDILL